MITIRQGTVKEIVDLCTTIPELDEAVVDEQYVNSKIGDKRNLPLVALIEDEIVGFVLCYEKTPELFYCWLAGVLPEARRQGVLSSLMEEAEKYAKESGYKKLGMKTKNKFRGMLTYLATHNFDIVGFIEKEGKIVAEKTLN